MSEGADVEPTIFISDDDEDLLNDEWLDDAGGHHNDAILYASHIQLQMRLCFVLVGALPVLAALIALAWCRFGDLVSHVLQQPAPPPRRDREQQRTRESKKAR